MFQQQNKATDCSFLAPYSHVCISSNWQLFVWVKKYWSWGEAALVLRQLYEAGSFMPWWVRSLSEGRYGKIYDYREQKEPRRPEKHAVFTGHRELLPVLTDIIHWGLEKNRYIRNGQNFRWCFLNAFSWCCRSLDSHTEGWQDSSHFLHFHPLRLSPCFYTFAKSVFLNMICIKSIWSL